MSAAPLPGLSTVSGVSVVAAQPVQAASSGMVRGVPVCRWHGDRVLGGSPTRPVLQVGQVCQRNPTPTVGGSPTRCLFYRWVVCQTVDEQPSMLTAISLGDSWITGLSHCVVSDTCRQSPLPGLSTVSGVSVVAAQPVQAASSGMVSGESIQLSVRWHGDRVLVDGKCPVRWSSSRLLLGASFRWL